MHTLAFLAALLTSGSAVVSAGETWVEARATPRSAEERGRLAGLGFEIKPAGDIAPSSAEVFLPASDLGVLAASGVPFTVVHADLEAFYRARLAAGTSAGILASGSMGGYKTLDEAVAALDALAAAYPGLLAPKVQRGTSRQGRPIWAWRLASGVDAAAPTAVILSLMHAREPAGMMSVLHFAEVLLQGYGVEDEATWLLDHRVVWLVPVLNPDGYEWNRSQNPGGGGMWRKNRRDNGDKTVGVDINRNFGYQWGVDNSGSSPSTSSDVYRGTAAFSEPETVAVRELVIAERPTVVVNTHTYGDDLIRPWDYADLLCADDAVFEDLSRAAVRGSAYDTGNVMQTLGYLANGGHDDWMYGDTVTKPLIYGVTPEAGNGNDGFWPAASRIDPIAAEMTPTFRALVWAAGAAPRFVALTVDDTVGGNGNGIAEPGETFQLTVTLRNRGVGATRGALTGELRSNVCGLRFEKSQARYGVVAPQTEAVNGTEPFVIHLGSGVKAGDRIALSLLLADDSGPYPPIPLSIRVGVPQVLFSDDLESGTTRWVLTGWAREAAGAGRAGQALSDSPGKDYADNANVTAQIKSPFDLSGAGRAYLVFRQRFWIDNDFDAGFVEASSDAGRTWTSLRAEGSDVGSGVGAQPAGAPVYDGRIFEWSEEYVDLAAFTGPGKTDVRLRFRFASDNSIGFDGWYVDDVRVVAFPPAADPLPPADPGPIRAIRNGADAVFTWPQVTAADDYQLYRSGAIRADGGFAVIVTTPIAGATDPGAAAARASYAYQAVAGNCAGLSSPVPR